MREIKFRGKRKDNGEWVYGYFAMNGGKCWIITKFYDGSFSHWVEVIPETVGQYTGSKDKNRKEIYEGDILGYKDGDIIGVIKWDNVYSGFIIEGEWIESLRPDTINEFGKVVVGNIHDNPKLIDGGR